MPILAWYIEFFSDDLVREILLFYIMVRIIMFIFLSDAVSLFLGSFLVGILQV